MIKCSYIVKVGTVYRYLFFFFITFSSKYFRIDSVSTAELPFGFVAVTHMTLRGCYDQCAERFKWNKCPRSKTPNPEKRKSQRRDRDRYSIRRHISKSQMVIRTGKQWTETGDKWQQSRPETMFYRQMVMIHDVCEHPCALSVGNEQDNRGIGCHSGVGLTRIVPYSPALAYILLFVDSVM